MSSFLKSSGLACVLLLSQFSHQAYAIKNGFVPNEINVINPGNGGITNLWKFSGYSSQINPVLNPGTPEYKVLSAVQIAPRWILGARHAIPNMAYFAYVYKNQWGSAPVQSCYPASEDYYLCKLGAAINPTGGIAFPRLLSDNLGASSNPIATSSSSNSINDRLKGHFLGVGFGLPTIGQPTAGWTKSTGVAASFSFPDNTTVLSPLPQSWDSGSPVFWYAPEDTGNLGVLVGIEVGAIAIPYGMLGFNESRKAWINSVLASDGSTVTWLTRTQYSTAVWPVQLQTPPRLIGPTTSNVVSIGWIQPTITDGSTLNFYGVALAQGTNLLSLDTVDTDAALNYTFSGLTTNTEYRACVLPHNASGYAGVGRWGANGVGDISTNCLTFTTYVTPGAVRNLSIATSPGDCGGDPVGCVFVNATWNAPLPIAGVSSVNYQTVFGAGGPNATSANSFTWTYRYPLGTHKQVCFSVKAMHGTSAGPVSTSCFMTP